MYRNCHVNVNLSFVACEVTFVLKFDAAGVDCCSRTVEQSWGVVQNFTNKLDSQGKYYKYLSKFQFWNLVCKFSFISSIVIKFHLCIFIIYLVYQGFHIFWGGGDGGLCFVVLDHPLCCWDRNSYQFHKIWFNFFFNHFSSFN